MRLSDELRQRCKRFASACIRLFANLPKNDQAVEILGRQFLRAGTSVAAHSREASRARSNAEFCSKIDGLLQEADETQLWLELLNEDCAITGDQINALLQESTEILAIFTTIISRTRSLSEGKR